MRYRSLVAAPGVLVALLLLSGCPPKIGDACQQAANCSVNQDRLCDLAEPQGYCTIQGCDPDTCPDAAICVEWRYDLARAAETWCMAKCKSDSECRSNEGYACVAPDDPRLLSSGVPIARIVDTKPATPTFCVAVGP